MECEGACECEHVVCEGACECEHVVCEAHVGCEGACVISVQTVAGHEDIEEHRLEVVTEAESGRKYEIEQGWRREGRGEGEGRIEDLK